MARTMDAPRARPVKISAGGIDLPPAFLPKTIAGLEALSRNGLRYPIPQYGINTDARAGLGVSYPDRNR